MVVPILPRMNPPSSKLCGLITKKISGWALFWPIKRQAAEFYTDIFANDQRATGFPRLLSIGLGNLIWACGTVSPGRKSEKLSGLYYGNPIRATNRPTTEAMLQAFEDIFHNFVTVGNQTYRHISPLSKLQQKILNLLDLPDSIYNNLSVDSTNPT